MPRKKTKEQLIEELKDKNPNVEIVGEYNGTHMPIEYKCLKCGEIKSGTPSDLLNGHGCRECSTKLQAEKNTYTHDEFISKVKNKNPNIIVLDEYTKASNYINCKCKVCGTIWRPKGAYLLVGNGCPVCARKHLNSIAQIKRDNRHEDFINEIAKISPNIIIQSSYKHSHEKVKCECKVCGNKWLSSPHALLMNHGCRICGIESARKKRVKKSDVFIEEMKCRNTDIEIKGNYVNSKYPIECRCKKCGCEWKATPNNLLKSNGTGCPNCAFSKGEDNIKKFLTMNNVRHLSQKSFDGLFGVGGGKLTYDFYIPDMNLLIEYQGQFHDGNITSGMQTPEALKKQQEHDRRKREYAKIHNIDLLEIWYWDFDNINNILDKVFDIN